jgi:hypothetical protein
MKRATLTSLSFALVAIGLSAGCSSAAPHSGFDGNDPNADPQAATTDPQADSGSGSFQQGGDAGANDTTCAATTAQPEKPKVDIIFVIDDSASMNAEMNQVRTNANAFAAKIGQSGLDYRVVFIVKRATSPSQAGNVICVPPPLGGANCADGPLFRHVNQDVQSNNSLALVLSTYDDPNPQIAWQSFLRFEAFKVFVEVSDDGGYDMAHTTFDQELLAKPPAGMFGTAQQRKYMFHAICGWSTGTTPPSATKCATADHAGVTYQSLAMLTGGIIDSVCKTDYSGVLDNLAKGIASKLACDLGYPKGQASDPTKVVVQSTPPSGAATKLTQVTDASKCGAVADAWYYDDPSAPTKIVLCPSTCDAAAAGGNRIDALVGCKAPPPK